MARGPQTPDLVPLLSRGRHRNPRKGACFMELASYLAGERWSDHPACTHPLLGLLARLVDDHISDSARQRLTLLVPEVIGLTSEDLRVDARITLTCSTTALPVVSAERQRVMAVSMLTCLRVLGHLDVDPVTPVTKRTRTALAQVPDATDWAERFSRDITPSAAAFRGRSAPAAVRLAVLGIADSFVAEPDALLCQLLHTVILEWDSYTSVPRGCHPTDPNQAPGATPPYPV